MKRYLLIILPLSFIILSVFVFFNAKKTFNNRIAANILDYSGQLKKDERQGVYDSANISVPDYIFNEEKPLVLGAAEGEKWIEVDLSEQKLWAWEGDKLFLETLVSTGLPYFPTPQGEFRIWIKLRATKMEGGTGKYYYNLPNVPYVMFFEGDTLPRWRGYGLHGAYWHNDFGTPHSHGCVNLPIPMAKELYYWTTPTMPEKKSVVYATEDSPGTRIVIHE